RDTDLTPLPLKPFPPDWAVSPRDAATFLRCNIKFREPVVKKKFPSSFSACRTDSSGIQNSKFSRPKSPKAGRTIWDGTHAGGWGDARCRAAGREGQLQSQ